MLGLVRIVTADERHKDGQTSATKRNLYHHSLNVDPYNAALSINATVVCNLTVFGQGA